MGGVGGMGRTSKGPKKLTAESSPINNEQRTTNHQ